MNSIARLSAAAMALGVTLALAVGVSPASANSPEVASQGAAASEETHWTSYFTCNFYKARVRYKIAADKNGDLIRPDGYDVTLDSGHGKLKKITLKEFDSKGNEKGEFHSEPTDKTSKVKVDFPTDRIPWLRQADGVGYTLKVTSTEGDACTKTGSLPKS